MIYSGQDADPSFVGPVTYPPHYDPTWIWEDRSVVRKLPPLLDTPSAPGPRLPERPYLLLAPVSWDALDLSQSAGWTRDGWALKATTDGIGYWGDDDIRWTRKRVPLIRAWEIVSRPRRRKTPPLGETWPEIWRNRHPKHEDLGPWRAKDAARVARLKERFPKRPLSGAEFREYAEIAVRQIRMAVRPGVYEESYKKRPRQAAREWNRRERQVEGLQNAVLGILHDRAYAREEFPSYLSFTRWLEARARQHDKRAKARDYGIMPPEAELTKSGWCHGHGLDQPCPTCKYEGSGPFVSHRKPQMVEYDDGQRVAEGGYPNGPEAEDSAFADVDPWTDPVHVETALHSLPAPAEDMLDRIDEAIEWHRARRKALKAEMNVLMDHAPRSPRREGAKAYIVRQALQAALDRLGRDAPMLPQGMVRPPELIAAVERWDRHRTIVNLLKKLKKAVKKGHPDQIEQVVEQAKRMSLVAVFYNGHMLLHQPQAGEVSPFELRPNLLIDEAHRQKLDRHRRQREHVYEGKEMGTSADGWRTPLRSLAHPRTEPRPFKDDARDPERLPY